MAHATVTANFDQPFYIHLYFAAKIAFDLEVLGDIFTQQANVTFGHVLNTHIRVYPGVRKDFVRARRSDPKNIGQSYFDPLGARKINTFNSCHNSLSLSLLMFWILANNEQTAVSPYDLAF
jgi:hypothetical protein